MRTKWNSFAIVVLAALFLLAIPAILAAQQPPPPGQLAEQVYKNIQALKGTPAELITPTMRVMARDLGVTCEFCHRPYRYDAIDVAQLFSEAPAAGASGALN